MGFRINIHLAYLQTCRVWQRVERSQQPGCLPPGRWFPPSCHLQQRSTTHPGKNLPLQRGRWPVPHSRTRQMATRWSFRGLLEVPIGFQKHSHKQHEHPNIANIEASSHFHPNQCSRSLEQKYCAPCSMHPFKRLPYVVPPTVSVFQASYVQFAEQTHLATLSKSLTMEVTCPATQLWYKDVGLGYKTGHRVTAKITLPSSDKE